MSEDSATEFVSVFITTLDNQSFLINTALSSTVQSLKRQIETQTGIPESSQRLLHKSRKLQDGEELKTYLISSGEWIYLVSRLDTPPSSSLRALRVPRDLCPEELSEVLTQHSLTIENLITKRRNWTIGQWVDVKDTVGQWLDAQIANIQGNFIYVHYIGWPSRWDEWVHRDSPRIQIFRTQTCQSLGTPIRSPVPNSITENHLTCLQDENIAELNTKYMAQLNRRAKEWYSLEEGMQSAFCEENSAVVDRIGRFMADTARLIWARHRNQTSYLE